MDNRRNSLTEKATNRVTIKINPKVLDSLVEEQYRRWEKTGTEPTQDDLIRELIEIVRHPERLGSNINEAQSVQLSEETRNYIQLLMSVLEIGRMNSVRAVRQHLHKIYLAQQTALLEGAQEKSALHAAALIVRFIGSGAALRWGHQGWEVQKAGTLLTSETIDLLNKLGFITPQANVGQDEECSGEFVHHLLSNQGIERLDKISRRAFRANQNRAYFEYLDKLLELYQEHSTLREGTISYPVLVREKIQLAYHFALLYFAGTLHLFGITEELRLRIAQYSLTAMGPVIG
jgi:hypothetical protein